MKHFYSISTTIYSQTKPINCWSVSSTCLRKYICVYFFRCHQINSLSLFAPISFTFRYCYFAPLAFFLFLHIEQQTSMILLWLSLYDNSELISALWSFNSDSRCWFNDEKLKYSRDVCFFLYSIAIHCIEVAYCSVKTNFCNCQSIDFPIN